MKTKEQRREEAVVRQAEYAALTIEQKIGRAKGRRGASLKELMKLSKALKKEATKEK